MRSSAGMLTMCAMRAREVGPRIEPRSGWFGFYLTYGEMLPIFYAQGYSRRSTKTIPSVIKTWIIRERVECDEELEQDAPRGWKTDPGIAVWWPDLSDGSLAIMADNAGLAGSAIREAGKPHAPAPTAHTVESWQTRITAEASL